MARMAGSLINRYVRDMMRRKVRATVARHSATGDTEIVERCSRTLLRNPFYRWALRRYMSDKAEVCINTESLKFLTRTSPVLFKSISISAQQNLLDMLDGGTAFVTVQIHDGSPSLTRLLVDRQRPFTRIVGDAERHQRRLKALQLDTSHINLVERDVRCFSKLRSAVRSGHLICCAIDYKNESGKWANLNPAILGFAQRLTLPVVFTKNEVDDAGRVTISASEPHLVSDPVASAMAFQTFYNSIPGKTIDMTVKRYYQ